VKKIAIIFLLSFFCLVSTKCLAQESGTFLKISISQCKLWLFKDGKIFREYQVCTAKEKIVQQGKCPIGDGVVTKINTRPGWNPTAYTRWYLATKYHIYLPTDEIPYGHPLNYMGAFKIDLSHSVPGKGRVFRIHGLTAKTTNSIGKRESGGCTRMRNSEGLGLCDMISVGTPVKIIY
jgi:hypothetical protein